MLLQKDTSCNAPLKALAQHCLNLRQHLLINGHGEIWKDEERLIGLSMSRYRMTALTQPYYKKMGSLRSLTLSSQSENAVHRYNSTTKISEAVCGCGFQRHPHLHKQNKSVGGNKGATHGNAFYSDFECAHSFCSDCFWFWNVLEDSGGFLATTTAQTHGT